MSHVPPTVLLRSVDLPPTVTASSAGLLALTQMPSDTRNVLLVPGVRICSKTMRPSALRLRTCTQHPLTPVPASTMAVRLGSTGASVAAVSGSLTVGAVGVDAVLVATWGAGVGVSDSPTPSQMSRATAMTPPIASHSSCSSVRRRLRGRPLRGGSEGRRGAEPSLRGARPPPSEERL